MRYTDEKNEGRVLTSTDAQRLWNLECFDSRPRIKVEFFRHDFTSVFFSGLSRMSRSFVAVYFWLVAVSYFYTHAVTTTHHSNSLSTAPQTATG